MERNKLLLLLIFGCVVSIVGFTLGQYLPTLVIVALIIIAFLYSDIQESRSTGRKNLKKNVAIAIFAVVTFYCMITGLWIFWAGITAILYVDFLVDSLTEWLDARDLISSSALKMIQPPETDCSKTLQSIQVSILLLEKRLNDLEQRKSE